MPADLTSLQPTASAAAVKKKPVKKKPVKKKPVKKKPVSKSQCKTVTKRVRGRRVKVRVCPKKPVAKKPVVVIKPVPQQPVVVVIKPVPELPVVVENPPPKYVPPPTVAPSLPDDPPDALTGNLTRKQAERLLWRAGFGSRPGEIDSLVGLPVATAIQRFTRVNPLQRTYSGQSYFPTLPPGSVYGREHSEWLSKMSRANEPLIDKMALIFHDWFATVAIFGQIELNIAQIDMFRDKCLGSFDDLLRAVTLDPAMMSFLDQVQSSAVAPNENYARELMELFTLGAGRGAYTQQDVKEVSRALVGLGAIWDDWLGKFRNYRYYSERRIVGNKTIFGVSRDWQWTDGQPANQSVDLIKKILDHPLHASFFCNKMWSYFVPTEPSETTLSQLAMVYTTNGRSIRKVVEAILAHPDCLAGQKMTIPPVVYAAGLLRVTGAEVTSYGGPFGGDFWYFLCKTAGQQLYYPPNVAGWEQTSWLDTGTLRGRWLIANEVLNQVQGFFGPGGTWASDETAEQAVDQALAYWGHPTISNLTRYHLVEFAERFSLVARDSTPLRQTAERQNALRMLVATCPDMNVR